MLDDIRVRAAESRAWLFDAALPLWSTAGFDAVKGLFEEKLTLLGERCSGHRRVRVQARQAFVFAEAGRMGWPGPWRELVDAGLTVLSQQAPLPTGAIGHLLDSSGRLLDDRWDLYDQAFGLLALARIEPHAPRQATTMISAMLRHLDRQRSLYGGYLEGDVQPTPRGQNAHMHLFEAAIALTEAGVAQGPALAARMVRLFDVHFFDANSGSLGEFFTDDLSPLPGAVGRHVEPGHHFEWIWLLERWRRLGGGDRGHAVGRLRTHALTHGRMSAVVVDAVWRDGGIKSAAARLWPQTERLKAALLDLETGGGIVAAQEVIDAYDGLALYWKDVRPGLWRDKRLEGGDFVAEDAPASSLYHVISAISELQRVAADL